MENQSSESNIFVNPVKDENKLRLLLELFQGGLLNTLVKRKLRPTVEKVLRTKEGEEFAANNWNHITQMVINVHLKITYPDIYKNASNDDQVKKIKDTYPLQLQMLETVSKMIEEGKIDINKNANHIQTALGI